MILYGASGHAKVVLDICLKNKESVVCIIDDDSDKKSLLSYPVTNQFDKERFGNEKIIITIGNNTIRKKLATSLTVEFGKAIHPNCIIDATVAIDEGTVIMANAVINSSTVIGKHCIINTAASVDHDCFIDNFVHISPQATLCGGVHVGEGTHIGAGAVILPNVKVGKWCIIGAGSVVLKDVEDEAKIVGNPGIKI